ncbi:MAG: cbb3-type cytochrome c oxidase subunit II, partial [Armatimonadota bacterium]
DPQSVVPESVMPKYGFLMNNVISPESTYIVDVMATNRFVGVPYSVEELFTTEAGGTPYGPSHVAGQDADRPLGDAEATICRALGRRVAEIAGRLSE